MNEEKDVVILTSFVALGIVTISVIATVLHDMLSLIPVIVFGLISFPLLLVENKPKIAHLTENIENIIFIITFLIIAISFIILFKPA